MIRYRCDRCGAMLDDDGTNRYIVSIEVYAAAGPIEFSDEDLRKDHTEAINQLVRDLGNADADVVEDQVYRRFRFDLCPPCHRRYIENPLNAAGE